MKRAALLVGLLVAAGPCLAACTFRAVTAVNFGAYNVFSAVDDDSTGNVRIRCTPNNTPYTLLFSAGAAGSFTPRSMISGAERLAYNLYIDAARSQIWGDGTGGTQYLSSPGHIGNANYTIYGRIPAGQDPRVGAFTDTIVMTLNF